MVNEETVERLLTNLRSYVRQLKDATDIDYQTYVDDIRSQRFVERTLQIAVEATMDIAHHIISDEGLREPNSYADSFAVLAENGIISNEMKETGRLMARFRNRVVHYYETIDPELVYAIFSKHLDDFVRFEGEIRQWLASQRKK
jgi:uncharacterized protein YutE (UPF0331/DUF86 family)